MRLQNGSNVSTDLRKVAASVAVRSKEVEAGGGYEPGVLSAAGLMVSEPSMMAN